MLSKMHHVIVKLMQCTEVNYYANILCNVYWYAKGGNMHTAVDDDDVIYLYVPVDEPPGF